MYSHVNFAPLTIGALDMQQNVCRPNTAEDDEYYDIPVTEKGARTPPVKFRHWTAYLCRQNAIDQ